MGPFQGVLFLKNMMFQNSDRTERSEVPPAVCAEGPAMASAKGASLNILKDFK
jgi:hypothetical protein